MTTTKKPIPAAKKIGAPSPAAHTAKQTAVTPAQTSPSDPRAGLVKIFHQQSVRQSAHYQSAELVYGVELYVQGDSASIAKGILAAETIVENSLGDKLPQMQQLLQGLASTNQS